MADADSLIAVVVFNEAQAAEVPVTKELVRQVVDRLLAHPAKCQDEFCEAAVIARRIDVLNIAASWQRTVAQLPRRLVR